jgi:hypothetical protein
MKSLGVNDWLFDVLDELELLELELELEAPVKLVGNREFSALMTVLSASSV